MTRFSIVDTAMSAAAVIEYISINFNRILECFKNFKNARIPGPQAVLGSPTPDYPEKIFFFGLTPILGKRNVFEILF